MALASMLLLISIDGLMTANAINKPAALIATPHRLDASSMPSTPSTLSTPLTRIADTYIARMSLDDKLGQLFFPMFPCCGYTPATAAMVQHLHIGGGLLYALNVPNASFTRNLLSTAQSNSPIPMLFTIDEEGGSVDRLRAVYGWRPGPAQMVSSGATRYAQDQGVQTARDMAALGFNLNLAPDVDVQLVAGPNQIGRTFGSDPQTVTTYAGAFLTGLQENGVVGCLKHFPGLGAAGIDAHQGLPVINRTRQQIEDVELAPYRALIATGKVQCVMTTDLLMPAIDPNLPAELSPTLIDGVLRGELGFDGVVMTDALYMQGISSRYSLPEAAVRAILAGCDMMEGMSSPAQVRAMKNALRAAIASGRLTEARIDQSVKRILILKARLGLIPITQVPG
jgi:beta-N-acetylhexosaminidase